MTSIKISPSILSADFSKLGNEIQNLEKAEADLIHIDVMDGHFVPNITIGPEVISKLRKYTSLPFDVHLMISPVHNFIKNFAEAGADMVFVQSTVTTARHVSKSKRGLIFSELLDLIDIPIIVGNCVSYNVALELMDTGVHGVLIGVGPGAACTTREVTGVGVPQVTATLQVSAARDEYLKQTGRYVPVITDGGIRTGGDVCKSFVSGADAIMIGSPLAQSEEAPGGGYNWGMAGPHPRLPRGTRVNVGTQGPLEQILFGPTSKTNGTQNLIGALEECMGMVGAFNIREMQKANMHLIMAVLD